MINWLRTLIGITPTFNVQKAHSRAEDYKDQPDGQEPRRSELLKEVTANHMMMPETILSRHDFARELLDRSFIAATFVDDFVLSQPLCVCDPELFKLAYEAHERLLRLYQAAAQYPKD